MSDLLWLVLLVGVTVGGFFQLRAWWRTYQVRRELIRVEREAESRRVVQMQARAKRRRRERVDGGDHD